MTEVHSGMYHIDCEVCEGELERLYCTTNVCKSCCEDGKCPSEYFCAFKHPEFKGKSLGQRLWMIKES